MQTVLFHLSERSWEARKVCCEEQLSGVWRRGPGSYCPQDQHMSDCIVLLACICCRCHVSLDCCQLVGVLVDSSLVKSESL